MRKRLGAGDVVSGSPGLGGDGENALSRSEQEFGFGIDKPPDQPGTGDPVYLRPLAGDPSVRSRGALAAKREPEFAPTRDAMFEITGAAPGRAERRRRILADFLSVNAIDDDRTPRGQLAAPMIDRLGKPPDRADNHCIVGIESRAPANVDDDRSQLGAEPDIKSLWRNRKTAFMFHDRALLASRVAQSLDGGPSDGASALPRGRNI